MNTLRLVTAFVGVMLIAYAVYSAVRISNTPIAVLSVGGATVEVLPSGGPLSVLSMEAPRGVRLWVSNASEVTVNGVRYGPNGSIYVSGEGAVPVRINGEEIRLLFDSEGRFLALSTSGGASVSGAQVSEEFGKAVLTYTLAPFVAGLAFTFGSLAVSREVKVRRR